MENKVELELGNADRIIADLIEGNTIELPEIPGKNVEGLLTKLREKDVPVLATPVAHG
ncbi:MAG: hypothetical protein ABL999_03690 [Pyrinomonadaceae bacterium]